MTVVLKGTGTMWNQKIATDEQRRADNSHLWDVLFVSGPSRPDVRPIVFAGQEGANPVELWGYLINKQKDGDELATERAGAGTARCVFCRHPFGSKYDDPFFGQIEIKRNPRNRNYCNQCDYFIRVCPGQATLELPVLTVDVRESRRIRQEIGDLWEYSRVLLRFQQTVAAEIQRNLGFIINTIGDAVVGVWPSGFVPQAVRDRLGWDDRRPARIPARCAIDTARSLADLAPREFDGRNLPFRGVVDTTDMIIFAVTAPDPDESIFDALPGDDVGEPFAGVATSEIPAGPAAVDIAGEAIEVASELASHKDALAGHMYISQRTDLVADADTLGLEYAPRGGSGVPTRVIEGAL